MVEIANAGVIGSYPIFSWQGNVEDFIHIFVDCEVSIEEAAAFIGSELEGSKLSPCILKASCNERDWAVGQQWFDGVHRYEGIALSFELEGADGRVWKRGCDEDNKRINGRMGAKTVS